MLRCRKTGADLSWRSAISRILMGCFDSEVLADQEIYETVEAVERDLQLGSDG